MDMNDKMAKNKALDVMIAIGTKKGLGMKEEGKDYKEPSMEEDMKEDSSEGEMNMCENCDKEMVCSGCNKPESECTC